jgi:hypothetical protein
MPVKQAAIHTPFQGQSFVGRGLDIDSKDIKAPAPCFYLPRSFAPKVFRRA